MVEPFRSPDQIEGRRRGPAHHYDATVGGNPEIVQDGENGLLVPYNDEKAWEQAIDKLLSDEALQERFSLNAKKRWKNLNGAS